MIIQSKAQLASMIDHTLLSPTATSDDIQRLCEQARQNGFYSVCVNPRWVAVAADILAGSKVKTVGVVSFPLGADSTKSKIAEARELIFAGADELDMVADLAAIIQGDEGYIRSEMVGVLKTCIVMHPPVSLKVIIEAAALNEAQKRLVCHIASECGVDFVKTSTGLHPAGGATVEDVKLLCEAAAKCKVKASGGIKTARQALAMIEAGASRIGTSSGIAIIEEFEKGIGNESL